MEREVVSQNLLVTVDLFSGLPNPFFELSEDQATTLNGLTKTLQPTSSTLKPQENLGYRGFRVESPKDRAERYFNLITNNQDVWFEENKKITRKFDDSRLIERYLWEISKLHLDSQTVNLISSIADL